tara:strand:+ start:2270 stop:2620 length:351 start_codon:yes stop_codon:yes gene_type:complete
LKPLFNTITSDDWRISIDRARSTPNDISHQIRNIINKTMITYGELELIREEDHGPCLYCLQLEAEWVMTEGEKGTLDEGKFWELDWLEATDELGSVFDLTEQEEDEASSTIYPETE